MDRHGPRVVIEMRRVPDGAPACSWRPPITEPWQLYATLGVLVGAGANLMTFTAQSLFLPNWFVRRRGLAISIAFSGVGVGAIVLLPWLQTIIGQRRLARRVLGDGPARAARARRRSTCSCGSEPQDIGLLPDGASHARRVGQPRGRSNIVDPAWAAIDWTLARAMRTGRFWWIAAGLLLRARSPGTRCRSTRRST